MNNKYISNNILIELLKQYGVKKLVLSSGCRNIPFVSTVETDDDFECFSVIDERNAAFFGLGLSQRSNEPVAIACTSGTATSNYMTGITEAFYSNVPIIVITFDRNPHTYNQLETQKIDQESIFKSITKKSVTLPIIKDEDDIWYCKRLVNEALISFNKHGKGPVHINIPLIGDTNDLYNNLSKKENVNRIDYITQFDDNKWDKSIELIKQYTKKLIIIGQRSFISKQEQDEIEKFAKITKSVILTDNLSNFKSDNIIMAGPIIKGLNRKTVDKLLPELIISFGNNMQERIKELFRNKNIKHWSIDESGEIKDCFKSMTAIYECAPEYFFKKINSKIDNKYEADEKYLNNWNAVSKAITLPEMPFTNFYIAKELSKIIPKNSMLHLSILNATRQMQFFKLDKTIKTYSNVNSFGIDGCLPTFMGQAHESKDLAFIVIGDLSFFYGMNALAIKHIKNNVRVLMINNGGAAEFHIQPDSDSIPTIDKHIGAAHKRTAKDWAISLGYDYLSANDKETFNTNLETFISKDHKNPVFFEVFTDMKIDGQFCLAVYRHIEKSIESTLEEIK